jgi:hypothetical protein
MAGKEPRGTIKGQQVFVKDDGIYFGDQNIQKWRLNPTSEGEPVWQNDSNGTFNTVERYVEVNSKKGPVVMSSGSTQGPKPVRATANYTVTLADRWIAVDATSGAITVTLPAANTMNGVFVGIGKEDSSTNAVTIDANASETINGMLTHVLTQQFEGIDLQSDGTNWNVTEFHGAEGTARSNHRVITTNYTATNKDQGIECDSSGGAFTVTLPTVASVGIGFSLGIGKSDSSTNPVTIDGNGSETINGNTTYSLKSPYQGVELISTATAWRVKQEFGGEGGKSNAIRTVTNADSPVTSTAVDDMVHCDCSSGAITVNLPAAATVGAGWHLNVGKIDTAGNAVTIDGNGSETIGGSATQVLTLPHEAMDIESDGTNWRIVGRAPGMPHVLASTTPFEATVANATTSITVTHNMGFTPHASEIYIVPTNNLGSASHWWVDTITSTQFNINTDSDPGVTTATFAWRMLH